MECTEEERRQYMSLSLSLCVVGCLTEEEKNAEGREEGHSN
jgi:hypothetical protein